MRESCLVYCYSGIQSLFEVVLLYTFYTVHLLKNNTVFSECTSPYSPDYGIFMQSTERAVQY